MNLPGEWRPLGSGISMWFEAPSASAGAALVARIAGAGFDLPEVNLRIGGVQIRVDSEDGELAGAISAAAAELGLTADPSVLQAMRLRVAAIDSSSVIPFWHAVLGYSVGDDGLFDPLRRDPAFFFQPRTESLPLRNRLHVDVSRLQTLTAGAAAAKAAGGRETFAGEYYRTIADPEGNEVDIVPGEELSDGAGTADWRIMFGGMTFYPTASPEQTVELATAVAGLVDDTGMPLMVDLRPDGVAIDTGKDLWEDDRFADLARRIQLAAHDLGLTADPGRLRFVQFGIDAVDVPAVRRFWVSLLGYDVHPHPELTDITDPRWLNPPLFFQQMDAADEERRRQRNRIRLEIAVPEDQIQHRIETAVAAGGRLVEQQSAHHWTVADPENNDVDLVTAVP
jgi:hypothetical protein